MKYTVIVNLKGRLSLTRSSFRGNDSLVSVLIIFIMYTEACAVGASFVFYI